MKILLVEDDQRLADLLTKTLGHQNHLVDWVVDGQQGWEYADIGSYDLLLLDVVLPRLDGISLCKRLRAEGYQQPILMLTSLDTGTDKVQGLDAGADDYVVKPFDLNELLARIRALVRRKASVTSTELEWEYLKLNPVSCQVYYQDIPLSLTPKEYSLLELFLRNENRVFSLNAILDQLWSMEDSPGEETVRVHIRGLRQKLRKAGAPDKVIETVYGLGYRLGLPPKPPDQGVLKVQAPAPGPAKVKAALAEAWLRFQPETLQQVERLSHTIEQWSSATSEIKQQAYHDAHQLSGLLGTYGLADGSKIARHLLAHLHITQPTSPEPELAAVKVVNQLVASLHQIVARDPTSTQLIKGILLSNSPTLATLIKQWVRPGFVEMHCFQLYIDPAIIQDLTPKVVLVDLTGMAPHQHPWLEHYTSGIFQPQLKWIALLDLPEDITDLQCLIQAGITDFISQPFKPVEVLARILLQATQ